MALDLVDLRDVLVGELLKLLLGSLQLIFRDRALALKLLQLVLRVAADVPDGNASLLGAMVDLLDELLAALLGERREGEADHAAVVATA